MVRLLICELDLKRRTNVYDHHFAGSQSHVSSKNYVVLFDVKSVDFGEILAVEEETGARIPKWGAAASRFHGCSPIASLIP